MSVYRRILAAVDVTEESRQVVEAAVAFADSSDAHLHVIHVIEPTNLAYGAVLLADLHSSEMLQMREQAAALVGDLASRFEIPADRQHVVTGRATSEIHRTAEAEGMDLIVVGSHGRHGLGLLLGSTANGVLHGAKCDVLAVRVKAPETT